MLIATKRPVLTAFIAVVPTLATALAAVPQADAQVLYACVKKNGSARVFAKKPKCKRGETKLSWNSEGIPGKSGKPGANGSKGTSGLNGKDGSPGANGAVEGFSATHTGEPVAFTTANEGTPTTIVSRTLPPGNYTVSGKTEVALSDNKSGGRAWIGCKLIDLPSGGGSTVRAPNKRQVCHA